jgi:hypothetical protein
MGHLRFLNQGQFSLKSMFPGNYKHRAPTIGIFTGTWKQSLEREVRNDVSLEEEGCSRGGGALASPAKLQSYHPSNLPASAALVTVIDQRQGMLYGI